MVQTAGSVQQNSQLNAACMLQQHICPHGMAQANDLLDSCRSDVFVMQGADIEHAICLSCEPDPLVMLSTANQLSHAPVSL